MEVGRCALCHAAVDGLNWLGRRLQVRCARKEEGVVLVFRPWMRTRDRGSSYKEVRRAGGLAANCRRNSVDSRWGTVVWAQKRNSRNCIWHGGTPAHHITVQIFLKNVGCIIEEGENMKEEDLIEMPRRRVSIVRWAGWRGEECKCGLQRRNYGFVRQYDQGWRRVGSFS